MNNFTLVSVIMPAYNSDKYIAESIESVLNQTYSNWELIIIDDGSTDNTRLIIEEYCLKDRRIKYYANEKNRGIAYTTNRAIQLSNGTYIALLDDDDVAICDRFKKQVNYLEEHKDIDVLGGRTIYIDAHGHEIGVSDIPRRNPKYNKAMLLFGGVSFSNSTAMIRRKFIDDNNIKYRDGCYGMQDVRFYMECSKCGNISAIDDYLLKYRMHAENETTRSMTIGADSRKRKFRELQEWSLKSSGFELDICEFNLLTNILSEAGGTCKNKEELCLFYQVIKKIYMQAKSNNIDYLEELEHVLKTRITWQVMRYERLFDEF